MLPPLAYTDGTAKLELLIEQNERIDHYLSAGGLFFRVFYRNDNRYYSHNYWHNSQTYW